MTVLLMVQGPGDERPKCVPCSSEYAVRPNRLAPHLAAWRGHDPEKARRNGGSFVAVLKADRWWLVEAASADDARRVIAGDVLRFVMDNGVYATEPFGRIFAHGGQERGNG